MIDPRVKILHLYIESMTKNMDRAYLASELACLAGEVGRRSARDECELEHAEEALIGHLQAEMRRR